MNASVAIPAPTDEDKPFPIGDEVTVHEGAMVYAGRHPCPKMFGPYEEHNKRERCLTLLTAGLKGKQRRRQRAQRSLDIQCQIMEQIKRGLIQPIKTAYGLDGEIDPSRTLIKTAELIRLANERREQPRYLRHLLKPSPAATDEERQVIDHAASILKDNPNAKRDDVRSACQTRFPELSHDRVFRYCIWPQARAKAGLFRRAPPGPKPKAG
jgi:hypothetical protein